MWRLGNGPANAWLSSNEFRARAFTSAIGRRRIGSRTGQLVS
jgi:hypothetical protein